MKQGQNKTNMILITKQFLKAIGANFQLQKIDGFRHYVMELRIL